jgi:diguanylate cyclase (GGDEF)-like protein
MNLIARPSDQETLDDLCRQRGDEICFLSRDGRNFYVKDQLPAQEGPVFSLDRLLSSVVGTDRLRIQASIARCLKTGEPFRLTTSFNVDGVVEDIVVLTGNRILFNGRHHIVLGFSLSAAAEENTAAGRRNSRIKQAFTEILDSVPCGLAIFDPKDQLSYYNSTLLEIFDTHAKRIRIGHSRAEVMSVILGDAPQRRAGADSHASASPHRITSRRLPGDRWIKVFETTNRNGYRVVTIFDITDLKNAEARLREQAEVDSLTGLLNRCAFFEHLRETLNGRRACDSNRGCIILLDLDYFKSVNDTHGHHFGDLYLVEIARRIANRIRRSDLAARLGGDEFIIYLHAVSPDDQMTLVESLHRKLTQRLVIEDKVIQPSISMGVVTLEGEFPGEDEIIKKADIALYKAKHAGRNVWRNFDPELERRNERRKYVLNALREALARGRIDIALQPQVIMPGGRHIGFEVLARWRYRNEWIPPAEFITIAEKHGLMPELGLLVMKKACRWHARMLELGLDPGRLALNVSVVQLKDGAFVDQAIRTLGACQMAPEEIELEVTETALIERDLDIIEHNLKRLSRHGFRISLDDFGTGNATFSHLKRFPIHILKIDRSFVDDIGRNSENTAIVRAIISIADNLNMEVIAEGVETEAQEKFLLAHGCHLAQGYRYARPLSPRAAQEWLQAHMPAASMPGNTPPA